MLCSICVILLVCSIELVCVKQVAEMFPHDFMVLAQHIADTLPGVYESNSPGTRAATACQPVDCEQYYVVS